jgi:hypothetical protein
MEREKGFEVAYPTLSYPILSYHITSHPITLHHTPFNIATTVSMSGWT